MDIAETLTTLGTRRVIWIDDCFVENAQELAQMLVVNLESSRACGFEQFEKFFQTADADAAASIHGVAQILVDLPKRDLSAIRDAFLAKQAELAGTPTDDLSPARNQLVCQLLSVTEEDRWSFEGAEDRLAQLCREGDESVSYVIDLDDATLDAGNHRGLELLKFLFDNQSKGTAFLLTHAASIEQEASWELQLRTSISQGAVDGPPVCVVAKERLEGTEPSAEEVVSSGLKIALKRAGLRRGVHEVLMQARGSMQEAFDSAARGLLAIPPEQLDEYVVAKGYREGVSELHVVERALTAQVSSNLRTLFASNAVAKASSLRLRSLRMVDLSAQSLGVHEVLDGFRKLEIWETEELINGANSPLAPGDVFEFDASEFNGTKMFLLLGQACDISLRPRGVRDSDFAYLVPLKPKDALPEGASKMKEPYLPFKLKNKFWACDFRNAASARLSILDLATFRSDGRVRFDQGQNACNNLLPGAEINEERLLAEMRALLDAARAQVTAPLQVPHLGSVSPGLQLTLSNAEPFRRIRLGTYKSAVPPGGADPLPERISWVIRRYGRIRSPYPASLLSNYLAVVGREAFDLDFTAHDGAPVAVPQVAQPGAAAA